MKNKMTFKFLETIWSCIKYCFFSKRTVSELNLIKSQFIHLEVIGNATRNSLLILIFFSCFSTAFAQVAVNLPQEKRCTSKDLELVGARVIQEGECFSCTADAPVLRTLILSIKNSTGSNRTSFAFWGILDRYNGNVLASSSLISGCNSTPLPGNIAAVPPNTITDLPFDQIAYICGQRLVIRNLYLAWTSAADNATCPLEPSKISPKCGTLPSIEINAGVNGTVTSVNATCTAGGSITVTPFGGTPPYSVKLDNGASFPVTAGNSKIFSGVAIGNHNITITDSTLPVNCSVIKPKAIEGPAAIPAPTATVNQPICTTTTGSVSVILPTANVVYTLKQGGSVIYTANPSGVFSSVAPGTYQFFASVGSCSTQGDDKTVNSPPVIPNAPTFCVVLPSLCDASKKGSLTILTPIGAVGEYEYSINNGTTWQAGLVFNGLEPGSVTGVKVKKVSSGCISNAAVCSESNICTPPSPARLRDPDAKISAPTAPKEEASKTEKVVFTVFPVPFKDQLTIRYNFDYVSHVLIEVFNSQGHKVLSKKDSNGYLNKEILLELNTTTGKSEVYIVKVSTDKGSSIQKVISSK